MCPRRGAYLKGQIAFIEIEAIRRAPDTVLLFAVIDDVEAITSVTEML